MAKITISYRRDDSMDITGRIFDRLASRYGRETVFRDIDNIPPGRDFREHIRASIDTSDVLMVVVGPRWMGDVRNGEPRIRGEVDYVRVEVEAALDRRMPVIPLLVGGATMPEPKQLPDSIREFAYRNAVHIDSGRDFDHHMTGLIQAMDKMLATATPTQPVAAPADSRAGRTDVQASGAATSSRQMGAAAVSQTPLVALVGGVMTVIGLMHLAWFIANLLAAMAGDGVRQMFQHVWNFADLSFGVGGTIIGIAILRGASWARGAGVVVCLLMVASNLMFFSDSFDRPLPWMIVIGTSLTALLALLGVYLLLFRWPAQIGER
jgi:hypothetical protein